MNVEIASRFERQSAWQRSRAAGPWAEKLRASVAMRSAVRVMRKEQPPAPPSRKARAGAGPRGGPRYSEALDLAGE